MCDYSLEMYHSQPAVTGETYTLHRFNSGTAGFVKATDCATAVCVPAGARLRLEGITSRMQRFYRLRPTEQVEMIRLPYSGHLHRDGVRFADGRELSLQLLDVGLLATLLPRDLSALFDLDELENRDAAPTEGYRSRSADASRALPRSIAAPAVRGFQQALSRVMSRLGRAQKGRAEGAHPGSALAYNTAPQSR